MDANEVAQMDKDSCIILPFASKPIIDKKYKPFHDPSYLKAKKYGPYTHPVEIFRDKNGNLHTVNHQEKFYFPDEGLQAKIRDDLKEGKSSGTVSYTHLDVYKRQVSTLDLMKAEKLRQEIDQEIAFDEPNKTVDQEEDPRVQEHKIIALKNGYTPEDVEEVASIYRSYYESLDEIEADLAAEGKPSNGSDYELRAENVRALRDQDLSYICLLYTSQWRI